MECQINKYDKNVESALSAFFRLCKKLTSSQIVYAGLLLCFVPSVFCEAEWPSQLTYESIYNSTSYAQLPHSIRRPYPTVTSYRDSNNHSNRYIEHTKAEDSSNYIEDDVRSSKSQLLVGFARDPFRYSVPDEDYRKGVREINPEYYTSKGENRGKRGALHLANMMLCATGCDPLAYKGYGCYCGFWGAGRPTDGIDRCCQMHDRCYEGIHCPLYTVYFQPYYWKCYRGQPLCALENFDTQHQFINGCAGRLCECDRLFAMCIKRYHCPRKRALCRSSPIRLLQNLLMFK